MPRRPAKYTSEDLRRALCLLADSPGGRTEAILRAHGFSTDLIADLVKAEFVSARRERVGRGGQKVEIVRLRITELGQQHFDRAMTKPRETRTDRLRRALASARVALQNRSDPRRFEHLAIAALQDIEEALDETAPNHR